MKNVIKITAISSLLIIACLLIGACGSGGSQFVQGQGQVEIYVTNNSATPIALQGVTIEVRENSQTGTLINTYTTDQNGHVTWVSPTAGVGSNYYFKFIKTGYVNLQDTIQADLTATKTVIEKMTAAP